MELTRLLPLAALVAVTACADGGTRTQLLKAVVARAFGADAMAAAGGGEAGQPLPEAAALYGPVHEKGIAAIRIEAPATGVGDLMIAIQLEDDRLTYLGRSNRTVVLRGGLLAATHGFGYDPAPVETGANDPVAAPRPLADWPEGVSRIYRTVGMGPEGQRHEVDCTYAMGEAGVIAFLVPPLPVQTVTETCRGDIVRFANTYRVDPATGAIWASEQWTGPQQGMVRIDVVEPFEP